MSHGVGGVHQTAFLMEAVLVRPLVCPGGPGAHPTSSISYIPQCLSVADFRFFLRRIRLPDEQLKSLRVTGRRKSERCRCYLLDLFWWSLYLNPGAFAFSNLQSPLTAYLR